MALSLQVNLLRALKESVLERDGQDRPMRVDCRVVAANISCSMRPCGITGRHRR
jgi:transcriptional regulator with GAF, ATPase, and Fis domain